MKNSLFHERIARLLNETEITFNGHEPHDIQVHDERFYSRILAQGPLGLGESYMDGWWDCERIDEMIARLQHADIQKKLIPSISLLFDVIMARIVNHQSKRRAFQIGEAHYDIGNDLYRIMLDARMTYTCGYWKHANTLDEAQEAKLDLVCRKLGLKPGQRILDIGCGWGSFAKFAAEKYGVSVVGVTVSKNQVELGRKLCKGLPVEIRLQDYRDVDEPFDHIVSLGMIEHVGYKNYATYFDVVNRCLKDDGLFLLHTIGSGETRHSTDQWIEKYIFPNSMLPSATQLMTASERRFVMEDWHNFSADYDPTLMAWYHNIESRWAELAPHYSERFHRMWRYYLLSCAGTFRARKCQLWQIIFSKHGVPGGYAPVR
ncbi:MAG: cyclopropane fatty acyl phospholipid synthase [Patescibacteria group bacterium]